MSENSHDPIPKEEIVLSPADFESVLGERVSPQLSEWIEKHPFIYTNFSKIERDSWLLRIVKTINDYNVIPAGEHRLNQWEMGWHENLAILKKIKIDDALIPRYFGKYNAVRWKQDLIKPLSINFEYNMLAVIEYWLFEKYLGGVSSIYEFGCGTGHNLLRARQVNKTAVLHGCDWTTTTEKIISLLRDIGIEKKINGHIFNFFDPDNNLHMDRDSAVYTVAALEQAGHNFKNFITYLLNNKPKICIHIEPIAELLDETNFLDYLSVEYFKKRNYLSGFIHFLKKLEVDGRIKIHLAQRTSIGSLFVDGYSVVVWSPV